MEPKKTASVDVHQKRPAFFAIGLVTSLTAVIVAFEWLAEIQHHTILHPQPPPEEVVYTYPNFRVKEVSRQPEKRKPVAPVNFVAAEPDMPESAAVIEHNTDSLDVIVPVLEVPVEPVPEEPVLWTAHMPEPEGGYENFFDVLKREMKYPAKARINDIEGKVFVSFVVGKDGTLTDINVVKGIGGGCDEEAVRVLKLTRWTPGRQGARPVLVRMILPIHFRLH